jgi:hypothetical protein
MVAAGTELGPLVKDETQLAMKLPDSVEVESLLRQTETCAERQGGPPRRASLQYQPREIVLYLPKQCLLDKKVASSLNDVVGPAALRKRFEKPRLSGASPPDRGARTRTGDLQSPRLAR